jgi:hypothetical protein
LPLKLTVGVSRKLGLPGYSSVGASCALELELDAGLLESDLDGFHGRVRSAYVAAHQAVHDELARLQEPPRASPSGGERGDVCVEVHGRPDGSNGHPMETATPRRSPRRPATESQVRAIGSLARRRGADLGAVLREGFGVGEPDELTLAQASALIDRLRSDGVD